MINNEQIQALKGNHVRDSYYLVECGECGEIYPSNKLDGGCQIADTGDYGNCYCPHCGAAEEYAACFTEQGCRDYLARDGHNLRLPFIYAFGSFRNSEYQFVRKWLAGITLVVGVED